MSDPSAVIAEVLCGPHFDGMHLNINGGRLRWGSAFGISEGVIAALTAAGYAVVKLPEMVVDEMGAPTWPVVQHWNGTRTRDGEVRIRASDKKISAIAVSSPHDCAADARSLAAALLAAADAAEGVSDE